jgi:hypothetical protein
MLSTDIPSVFNIPWANSAIAPYVHAVPEASQISITPGAASLTDGFVPLNFLSYLAGGVPPFGNDMNGILNRITAWLRWTQAGGLPRYNSAFQTAIGGYPSGAVLIDATNKWLWVSTADSNATNPDAAGAGWLPLTPRYHAAGIAGGSGAAWTIPVAAATAASVPLYLNGLLYLSGVADVGGQTLTLSGVNITASPALGATDVIYFGEYRF